MKHMTFGLVLTAVLVTACGAKDETESVAGPTASTEAGLSDSPAPVEPEQVSSLFSTYEVIDVRRASGTAAPANLPGEREDPRGQKIVLEGAEVSVAGTPCLGWRLDLEEGPDVMDTDPILADLRLPSLDSEEPQPGKVFTLRCGTESVFSLYQADPRTIAIPWDNGATYLIAEKALTPDQIEAFQEQLKDMKFQPGPVSNTWTESGLIGLRSYYSYRARSEDAFTFQRPAITASLLEKLGVLSE